MAFDKFKKFSVGSFYVVSKKTVKCPEGTPWINRKMPQSNFRGGVKKE